MRKLLLLSMFTIIMSSITFALNHSGTISSNQAWFVGDNPHIITGNLTLADGVTLLIQPGCIIKFNGNYRFTVKGILSANGTSAAHIVFTSNQATPAKGDWRFIYFLNPDLGSIMNYCDVSYGGSVGTRGMINFKDEQNGLIITNCSLTNSGSYGFEYRNDVADPNISICTIQNCNKYPIYTYADRVRNLTGSMIITGNTPNAIYVRPQALNTGTWSNFNVPYILAGSITIDSAKVLTIDAGNVLKFNGNNLLTVLGKLVANGNSIQHIVFTSNQAVPAKGDWQYIYFNDPDSGSILNYCDISYGGSVATTRGMVSFRNASSGLIVSNCSLNNSGSYGFYYVNNAADPGISDCSIQNCDDYPIYTSADRVKDLTGSMVISWKHSECYLC